jgi:hypothetical protein
MHVDITTCNTKFIPKREQNSGSVDVIMLYIPQFFLMLKSIYENEENKKVYDPGQYYHMIKS